MLTTLDQKSRFLRKKKNIGFFNSNVTQVRLTNTFHDNHCYFALFFSNSYEKQIPVLVIVVRSSRILCGFSRSLNNFECHREGLVVRSLIRRNSAFDFHSIKVCNCFSIN
uniref:Uncharacterized protein n=1 Tax=Panagrolaimus sp. JU765 TaxID=591449 RepID=A0AC34Q9U8_9BILA